MVLFRAQLWLAPTDRSIYMYEYTPGLVCVLRRRYIVRHGGPAMFRFYETITIMDGCQIEAHASFCFLGGQHDVRLRFGSSSDLGLMATISGESQSWTLAVSHHQRHRQ